VYALFTRSPGQDSIVYVDTSGASLWTYALSGLGRNRTIHAIDREGNLLLVVPSSSPSLLKISPNGSKVFQSPILLNMTADIAGESYSTPIIDVDGNVWVVAEVLSSTERLHGEQSRSKSTAYVYAFHFDGTDGSLIDRIQVLKEQQSWSSDD